MQAAMRDLIVLIPGIGGSVLRRGEQDIWALSGQAIWSTVKSLGSHVQQLTIEDDNLDEDVLRDGITAPSLIQDLNLIPGLVKIDGYTAVSRMIKSKFKAIQRQADDLSPGNFFEFPYDWRRDCRVAARKLKNLIDFRLAQWRTFAGVDNAKVILIGHSMGGLVSRYYLEKLDGWKDCKALITFGTPFRGSVNSLNFLANGYKKLFLDFSEIIRSLPAVYQLLPVYKMVKIGDEYKRITEIESLPGIDPDRALEALKFHREIEEAVTEHKKDSNYNTNGYRIFPIVGIKQPTLQSAEFVDNKVVLSTAPPASVDPGWGDGDGTVPMLSAIPIELSNEYRDTFFPEKHSSIQNNSRVLDHIFNVLRRMQLGNVENLRGSEIKKEITEQPIISLDLEDLYVRDEETIVVRARQLGPQSSGKMRATIESADDSAFRKEYVFTDDSDGYMLRIEQLPRGLFRIKTEMTDAEFRPCAVHDVFAVV